MNGRTDFQIDLGLALMAYAIRYDWQKTKGELLEKLIQIFVLYRKETL